MSHVDDTRAVLDLGFENATYLRPAYAGETFRKSFIFKRLRTTSDGNNTVATIGCELHNLKHELVFQVDKVMLFYGLTNPNNRSVEPEAVKLPETKSHFLKRIFTNAGELPIHSHLAPIFSEELIIHGFTRPLGRSMTRSLSSLVRLTHPMLYDTNRFSDEEIVVSGGLILALTSAAASVKLYEILYEQLLHCVFTNRVSSVDAISALTYIESITPLASGLEEIKACTVGVKNVDVLNKLKGVGLPVELFTQQLKPAEVEELVAANCPVLQGKIVCLATRKLVRQSPYSHVNSIPLL